MVVVPPQARVVGAVDVVVVVREAGEFLGALVSSRRVLIFFLGLYGGEAYAVRLGREGGRELALGRVTRRRPPSGGYPLLRIWYLAVISRRPKPEKRRNLIRWCYILLQMRLHGALRAASGRWRTSGRRL